jgi:hypothetical protein
MRLPAESGASRLAISPWMWNSGMITSPQSPGASFSVVRMFRAEAAMLRWDRGTSFGREVVPEVCRISAMSSACANPPGALAPGSFGAEASSNAPAPSPGVGFSSSTLMPSLAATESAGDWLPCSMIRAFACRSDR